ncbi:MAG: M91 family zinc metallopeptidase [Acidobacteriota bacterium]
MTPKISKKNNADRPAVALFSQATRVTQQLEQASWRHVGSAARKIVDTLSAEEIRLLPEETRQRLMHHISSGRITKATRQAVNKLLTANLIEVEYQQRIVIKGPAEFVNTTKSHLASLTKLRLGQELLHSIGGSGKKVTIIPSERMSEAPPDDFKAAIPKGKTLKWRDLGGGEKILRGTGKGSNTTIKYNPMLTCSCDAPDWRKHPPEIALAHELIHADDAAHGRLDPDEIHGVRNYERQAVGLPPYENKYFTENRFRASWKTALPPRTQY